jgi:hypothetical protein
MHYRRFLIALPLHHTLALVFLIFVRIEFI